MDAVANLLDEPGNLLRVLGILPVRTTILPNITKWLVLLLTGIIIFTAADAVVNLTIAFSLLLARSPLGNLIEVLWLILDLIIPLGAYLLRQILIHRRLKHVPFLSYGWAFAFAAVLAVYAASKFDLEWLWPFGLILLLMLHKDVRLWLPASTRERLFRKSIPVEQPTSPG